MSFVNALNTSQVKFLKILTYTLKLKVKNKSTNENLTRELTLKIETLNSYIDLLSDLVSEKGMYYYEMFYRSLRYNLNEFVNIDDLYELNNSIYAFLERNVIRENTPQKELGTIINADFKKD